MSRRLKLIQRLWAAAYEIARQSWIKSNGRGDEARLLFEQNERLQKFSPAIIFAMLQFAMWLFDRWYKQGIIEPSVVMGSEEMAWIATENGSEAEVGTEILPVDYQFFGAFDE
jgi:hypothetical protein